MKKLAKLIITQELLVSFEPEIRNILIQNNHTPLERKCMQWAFHTGKFLIEKGVSSSDVRIAFGQMLICVNNVTEDFKPTDDKGEGYWWGYDPFALDAKYDEIHAWVLYRNHLIDFTSQFFESNFNFARLSLGDDKVYQWNRSLVPKVLFCRNVTNNKLYQEYGLKYKPIISLPLEDFEVVLDDENWYSNLLKFAKTKDFS